MGFFKYRWVTVKWIVTVALMVYAPLVQAKWAREVESDSRVEGLAALSNPLYLQDRYLYTVWGTVMVTALAALSIISVLKPWMKKAHRPAGATRPLEGTVTVPLQNAAGSREDCVVGGR